MEGEFSLVTEISHLLTQCLAPLPRRTHKRLVWFLAGILLAQSIVLRRIAVAQVRRGGDSLLVVSHERRLRRLLNDTHLTWGETYAPAIRRLVRWNVKQPVYLLVDESGHTDHHRVLMAALWYRGRALPLAWVQRPIRLPDSLSYWDLAHGLLQDVASLLPPELSVIVIADRAFGTPAFTDLVSARGWQWVVRVQGQTCFRDRQGCRWTLRTVVPRPGSRWTGCGAVFRKSGWRTACVVALWDCHHHEPLIVVSNRPLRWTLLQLYLRRGAIEHLFRDWKSAGWHWEASQVYQPAHCERLYLGMAWATLLTLCAGRQVASEILQRGTPPRAQAGLFRLGCERVQILCTSAQRHPPSWYLTLEETRSWDEQLAQTRIHQRLCAA